MGLKLLSEDEAVYISKGSTGVLLNINEAIEGFIGVAKYKVYGNSRIMRLGGKIKLSAWYLEVTGGERHKCVRVKRALPTLIRKGIEN